MKKSVKLFLAVFAVAFTVLLVTGTESKAAGTITGLKQTDASSTRVEFQWDAYLGANSVYYATYIGNSAADVQAGNAKKSSAYGTSGSISSLTEGATYYLRVNAYSDYSRTQLLASSAIIEVATGLPEVTGLAQTGATANAISMKWNAVAGATGYTIYRYNSYSDYTQVATTTATSGTVSGLTASSAVKYFVMATKTTSAGFTVTGDYYSTATMRTTPGKVANVAITNYWSNLNIADYGWTAVNNADGYQFQLLNNKGKSLYSTYTSSRSASVSPYFKGVFTKARVRGYITIGNTKVFGPWSGYNYNAACKKITLKRSANRKKITVSWKKITGAAGYKVYVSTKSNGGWKKVKTLSSKKKSCTITKCGKKKLSKKKRYYVKVEYLTKVGKKKVTSAIAGVGSIGY